MKYLVRNSRGDQIISNLDPSDLEIASLCKSQSELISSESGQFHLRHGWIVSSKTQIYLATSDKKVTGKIFKKYQEILSLFSEIISETHTQIRDYEQSISRRLKHNLVTYNGHILQEIYQLIPQERIISIEGKNQLKIIKESLLTNPDKTAQSFLRILKNANLEKAEFDVFDKLYRTDPKLSFFEHSIHKIILVTLNSFWLDFLELEIEVDIRPTEKRLILDYNSIAVALGHIFDNATKYCLPRSKVSLSFFENVLDDRFEIYIDMISLKVNKENKERIFQEGVSGEFAKKKECCGTGVGLYIARRMVELNNGTISFFPNTSPRENRQFDGFPYEKNRIRISFHDEVLKRR